MYPCIEYMGVGMGRALLRSREVSAGGGDNAMDVHYCHICINR